jgi:hypothetical protein
MTPKIYHETIDKRFIEYLESIGENEFLSLFDLTKKCSKEFYIDLFFNKSFEFMFPNTKDALYRLEVQFEVDFDKYDFSVSKDREFNMINLRTGDIIACNNEMKNPDFIVINRCEQYKGLTQGFDEWIKKNVNYERI